MRRFSKSFPDQLFTLLHRKPESTQHVCGLPVCLRDYLAQDFFQSFPGELATCPEALAYLETLASMTQSSVEAGHSTTREYSMQRNRGKVPTLQDVSAQTVFRFIAKRYNGPAGSHAQSAATTGREKQPNSESHGKKKKQYSYCGPWKAFVHKRLAGTAISKLNMHALAEEYRNLSHDEYQEYVELGLASSLKTARARPGHTEVDVSSICHRDADTLALVSSQSLSMLEYEDFCHLQSQQQRQKRSENQALQKRIDETLSQLKPVREVAHCLTESGGVALSASLRGLPTGQISGVRFHEWTPPAAQLAEERASDSDF